MMQQEKSVQLAREATLKDEELQKKAMSQKEAADASMKKEDGAMMEALKYSLVSQNNSGETGAVTFADAGAGKTKVTIALTGAPKDTPAEIVQRLNREINAVLGDPAIRSKMADLNSDPFVSTPAEFAKFTAEDVDKWAKVVKAAGIKIE